MEMIDKKSDHKFPDSPTVAVAGKPGQRACSVEPVSCHQKLVYVGYTQGTHNSFLGLCADPLHKSLLLSGRLLSFSEERRTGVSLEAIPIFTLNSYLDQGPPNAR